MSKLKRTTKETQIVADVRIGSGTASIDVDDRFLEHMVEKCVRRCGETLSQALHKKLTAPDHEARAPAARRSQSEALAPDG